MRMAFNTANTNYRRYLKARKLDTSSATAGTRSGSGANKTSKSLGREEKGKEGNDDHVMCIQLVPFMTRKKYDG